MWRAGLLFAVLLLNGCQPEPAPTLVASDFRVYLPLPGSNAAVAYFTLENTTDSAVNIESISSPQFAMVGVHETTVTDGVSRMQEIRNLTIAPQVAVGFEEGGLHLMLMNPLTTLAGDTVITLEFHYDRGGLLVIQTIATARLAVN